MSIPFASLDAATECANCGACCGGACTGNYGYCAQQPLCHTYSVRFAGDVEIPALTPVGLNADGVYDIFDPDGDSGVVKPLGLTVSDVKTDAAGNSTNQGFNSIQVPTCNLNSFAIYVSGVFCRSRIAYGHPNQERIIAAMLAVPNFAKELPNGDIKIL